MKSIEKYRMESEISVDILPISHEIHTNPWPPISMDILRISHDICRYLYPLRISWDIFTHLSQST